MKDSWKISNFPFDRQTLRLSIENLQFDKKDNQAKAQRFDMIIAQVLLLIYVIANIWFISQADKD